MAEVALEEAPARTQDKIDSLVEEFRQLSQSGQTRRPDVAFRLNDLPDDVKTQLLERLDPQSDQTLVHMLSIRSKSSNIKIARPKQEPEEKAETPKPSKPANPQSRLVLERPPTPGKMNRLGFFGLVAGAVGITAVAAAVANSFAKKGIEKAKEPPRPLLKLDPKHLPPGIDNK